MFSSNSRSSSSNVLSLNRADGQSKLTAKVPDTITSWVLSAFAINADVGLGVAEELAKVLNHCVFSSCR